MSKETDYYELQARLEASMAENESSSEVSESYYKVVALEKIIKNRKEHDSMLYEMQDKLEKLNTAESMLNQGVDGEEV